MARFGLVLGVLSARVPQRQRGICQGTAQFRGLFSSNWFRDSGLAQLVDLYRMAVENVEIVDTRSSSRSFESTLAAHILGSMLQAAQQKRLKGLQHDEKTRVVYMAGHVGLFC